MSLKTLLLAFLFVAASSNVHARSSDTAKTLIYIIGVNHTPTKFRNADSLLILLTDIRPDLILSETDTLSGYFKKDYTLVHPAWWYKFATSLRLVRKMAPEDEVIYPYLKLDPTVAVYPFDMAFTDRNGFVKQRIKGEQHWVNGIQDAYTKGNIPSAFDSVYHSLIEIYEQYYNTDIFQGTHRELNRRGLTDTLRLMMAREEQLSKILVDSVLALYRFKEWHSTHYSSWEQRNKVMAMNIIRFTEMTKAKRVVVFTGLLHKYYLEDRLGEERYLDRYILANYY